MTHQCKSRLNRYLILKVIRKGPTRTLYKAYDTKLKIVVALKRLHTADPLDLIGLKKEFRQLSTVSHPNLVDLHELHSGSSTRFRCCRYSHCCPCFFTMEWVSGKNILETVWRTPNFNGSIDYQFLREILVQMALGLQYLHHNGILHRDIKPEHIIVNTDGRSVLLDYGLAKPFSGHVPEWERSPDVDGTFAYMSPEALQGKSILPASDWFSLGTILYECLTGILPHTILGIDPLPPVALVQDTPEDLNLISLSLLDRDTTSRASGKEIINILGRERPYLFADLCPSDPSGPVHFRQNHEKEKKNVFF